MSAISFPAIFTGTMLAVMGLEGRYRTGLHMSPFACGVHGC